MERLLRRQDFLAAAKGRFVTSSSVLLQAVDRGDGKPPRLGFTCTKKLGNAVVRNRTRRRMKEAAGLVMSPHARDGFDYVLIGRASTRTRHFEALQKDIISALSKIHAPQGNATAKDMT